MKNNSIIKRLLIGLKKGWLTPTLPEDMLKLHNSVFIRILRVLGGFSVILIVTHRLEFLGPGMLHTLLVILCTIFIVLFNLYLFYINYHRIKHIYKLLKSGDLDVRNYK